MPNYFKPTKDEETNVRIFRTLVNSEDARIWTSKHHKGIWNWFLSSAAGKKYRSKNFKGRKGVRKYKYRNATHIDDINKLHPVFNSPNISDTNIDDEDESYTYSNNLKDALEPIKDTFTDAEPIKTDNSFDVLFNLMQQGYDIVTWVIDQVDGKTCPKCIEISELFMSSEEKPGKPAGFFTLPEFLGYKQEPILDEKGDPIKDENGMIKYNYIQVGSPYEHNAPIYDWSHPRCRCTLFVGKSNNPNDYKIISADGEK